MIEIYDDPILPGRFTGAKLALKPMHVWAVRVRLQVAELHRDIALFDIALDSKLRGCDVVSLRLSDVLAAGAVKRRGIVFQQKTGRPVHFEITEQTRRSLAAWLGCRKGPASEWLFPSRIIEGAHLSTRQYHRRVKAWTRLIGLEPSAYGTHSLRRTKVSLLYRKTGNLRACQLLLDTPSLKAQSDISGWRSMTLSSCPRGSKSNVRNGWIVLKKSAISSAEGRTRVSAK